MKILLALLAAIGVMTITPGALAQDDSEEENPATERVCVNTRAVRSFDALTDQHVYVQEGSNRHLLFTMRNRCPNLRNALGIAIKDTTSRVCSNGFGEIVYRDRMSGRSMQTCRIDTIEVVESREDAKAIVEARREAAKNE